MGGNLPRMHSQNVPKPRLKPGICGTLGPPAHEDCASSIPEPQCAHLPLHMQSATPPHQPQDAGVFLSSFFRLGQRGSEKCSDLPTVTQPDGGKDGIHTQELPLASQEQPCCYYGMLPTAAHTEVLRDPPQTSRNSQLCPPLAV